MLDILFTDNGPQIYLNEYQDFAAEVFSNSPVTIGVSWTDEDDQRSGLYFHNLYSALSTINTFSSQSLTISNFVTIFYRYI